MQLRNYQRTLVEAVLQGFSYNRSLLLQLDTGAGKSAIAATVIAHYLNRGLPVLFVAHLEEILLQIQDSLKGLGIESGVIKSGYPEDRSQPCQVASVQSLVNRELPSAALIVIDEADLSVSPSYRGLIACYGDRTKILGMTATPYRLDGIGLKAVYEKLIVGPSTRWLIQEGYLSDYRIARSKIKPNLQGIDRKFGEFEQSKLSKACNQPKLRGDLVDNYLHHAYGLQTIAFCVDRTHSEQVARDYQRRGIAATHIDCETSREDRRSILRDFIQGELQVVSNVQLFTRGLDLGSIARSLEIDAVPRVDCVQLARPAMSLALARQQWGRGLRPDGKTQPLIILDHAGLIDRHGRPDDPVVWSLDGAPVVAKSSSKTCRGCGAAIRRNSKFCPHCGYEYQQSERSVVPLVVPERLEEDWGQGSEQVQRDYKADRIREALSFLEEEEIDRIINVLGH